MMGLPCWGKKCISHKNKLHNEGDLFLFQEEKHSQHIVLRQELLHQNKTDQELKGLKLKNIHSLLFQNTT